MQRNLVISGLGLVGAPGADAESFFLGCYAGAPMFSSLALFANTEARSVGRVFDASLSEVLPRRDARKLDRFSLMALSAARQALSEANVEPGSSLRNDIGICIANSMAGWGFVEPLMYDLSRVGPDALTPYVATAWFPAAAQGEVSIREQLGGYSKTVSAGHAGAGFALELAVNQLLTNGESRGMLAGAAEAPLTPLVYAALAQAGRVSREDRYELFRSDFSGALLGEGAALLFVEAADDAKARDAARSIPLLACVSGANLGSVIDEAIASAGLGAHEIDWVMMEARGFADMDAEEEHALRKIFAGARGTAFSAPRTLFGDALSASMAMDIALGCLSLERQAVLPSRAGSNPRAYMLPGMHVEGRGLCREVARVLVYARGEDQQCCACIIGAPPEL